MASTKPTCRWGIITTGMIASWFVTDLLMPRDDAKAKHVIQCIGASSIQKGEDFVAKHMNGAPKPTLYGSYEEVYNDSNVDVVYIGTPHGFHKRDCLNAIAAGKNVLCEKAFTINAKEAREVLEAAKKKGVYLAEAMWLRHRPIVADLRRMLYEEKVIGDVWRFQGDFYDHIDIPSLPSTSRYRNPDLGAGSLLDLGIYTLTWAILMLDPKTPASSESPTVRAVQSFVMDIECSTSILLRYSSSGRQGVVTSTTNASRGNPYTFATIEGSNGYITIEGRVPSHPDAFYVHPKQNGAAKSEGKKYDYRKPFQGFPYEADNTALDVAAGRKESEIMPWSETIRVMEIMDEVRRQGGTVYPADK
ncbi:Oxidoreductase family, NAD-binding Rossmann fold [Geosmithia morbida]|uniref:D-xylose 1-dehydrogenase (NADP(+), D-xylono-1,5-lactone-forming) n=1 Tax=Geosmithia morbida TaxID=1094350 RepID=A0A9P4YLY1_9HYPO|nr:Oxidoreductase family, NAD-binding Rossmann fold [Geosmithia morbida]KAF4119408.1 Oxidoreductase family, NAD-binding Rossmann fold [Geosmithia morbida]